MTKKKKKILILSGIIAAVVIIVIAGAVMMLRNAADMMKGTLNGQTAVSELSMQDLSSVIYANGTVESQNKVSITTELTGQVKELYVQLGDYVEAGTPLLVMDDTELRKKISELEKQLSEQEVLQAKQKEINKRNLNYAKQEQSQTLAEAQKAVDQAKKHVDQASYAFENAQRIYHDYASDPEAEPDTLDSLKAAADESQQALNAANSALAEAESTYNTAVRSTNQQIQAAQDTIDTQGIGENDNTASSTLADLYSQLEKVTITAPQAGIITSLNISVGSIVSTGDLMVIEDHKNLKLSVSINETDILKLTTGMHAVIKSDALKDVEMGGTISKVINFASTSSNTSGMDAMQNMGAAGSSYSAEILIDGETNLLLGMNAKAEIVISEKKDALSTPYDSIIKEADGKTYVYLAKEENGSYTVKKVAVKTGEEGDYYTEILSDELKEGDYIVSFPDSVNEGDTISIDLEMKAE